MARPRIPRAYGIVQFTVRLLAFFLNITALGVLIAVMEMLDMGRSTYGTALSCHTIAMLMNGAEVMALTDGSDSIWRMHARAAMFFDLIVAVLGTAGSLLLAFSQHGRSEKQQNSEEYHRCQFLDMTEESRGHGVAVGMVAATTGLHGMVFAVWDILDHLHGSWARERNEKIRRIQAVTLGVGRTNSMTESSYKDD
jgi:hypothetical protein